MVSGCGSSEKDVESELGLEAKQQLIAMNIAIIETKRQDFIFPPRLLFTIFCGNF
jgi:hypothetical protein